MKPARPPRFRDLPPAARGFLAAAFAGALACAFAVPSSVADADVALLILIAGLCAAGNLFEVFAPGHYSLQPNLPFFFCGAVLLPPWAIGILALASYLPGWATHRFRWYMPAFNSANYVLAGIAVHVIAGATGATGGVESPVAVAGLAVAAVCFVALNHGLIGIAAALAKGRRPVEALAAAVRLGETAAGVPLDIALAATGACIASLWESFPGAIALAAGPIGLVYASLFVPMLRHKSRTDAKTGLYNFAHLNHLLVDALDDAQRKGTTVSVVMADLDHLRVVNNRFGHLAGDVTIAAVADVIGRYAGDDGAASRFGGEEFCLLLPGVAAAEAEEIAERVRAGVEALELVLPAGQAFSASISAGVATYPMHGATPEELLHAADVALYDAKLGGRNRVRVALPGQGSSSPLDSVSVSFRAIATGTATPAPDAGMPTSARSEADSDDAVAAPASQHAEPSGPPPPGRRFILGYAIALCVLAAAIAFASGSGAIGAQPVLFGLLVASVLALDSVRIDLFDRSNISPASVPVLALAALFGPLGPIAAEAAIFGVRLLQRTPVVKATFDFGALAVAGAAAAGIFALWDPHGAEALAVGALAGGAYYAVNMPLLAMVIALSSGKSPLANFREQLAWLLPHYIVFGTLGGFFLMIEAQVGFNAFVLFGLPTAAMWLAEKQYLDRSRSGVAELRRSHTELEGANERLRELLSHNHALLRRIQQSYLSTITSLARTIEAKDPYTGGHTERVAQVAAAIAVQLGMSDDDVRAVEVGAVIHDIGKIGISDSTLLKAGPLSDEERMEMQRHPEISSYILAELDLPPIVKQMCRNHHERFDGNGYPDGLVGEEIPLAARILTVADALDAMTSDRPYRKAMSVSTAMGIIVDNAGTQFCPHVVEALEACLKRNARLADAEPAPVGRTS